MYRGRYRHILWFFGKIILSFIWWDFILPHLGLRAISRRTRKQRFRKMAASFRQEAIRMGGVMIKVGQFMSARLDVLPREITDELAGLQDEVIPESFTDIRKVLEGEFGDVLETKYVEFEQTSQAAASIGQMHRAKIWHKTDGDSGEQILYDVAVKIQRPNIERIVEVDLSALKIVAGWLMQYGPIRKRANIPAILEELSHSLYEEIDYLHEGKNAERFAANFEGRVDIRVPRVIWSHTTRRVLTLEFIPAIKITDYEKIEAAGIDRARVASRLFDSYLKQIMDDRFFHADPHPGNLFVQPEGPADGGSPDWKLVFVDFGMAGEVTPTVFAGLREGLIGVGTQDAARLIKAYRTLDVLLPGADVDLLEKASARVFERFWGKSTSELMKLHASEAQAFIREFEDLVYEMPFQAPENIVLLVRCVGILSGMCTGLDPDFNIWTSVLPYTQKMIESEGGSQVKFVLEQAVEMLRLLTTLPGRTNALLNRIEQGKLEVHMPEMRGMYGRLERSNRQVTAAIVFGAFLFSGVQAYLGGALGLAEGLGAGALVSLLWLLFRR